MELLDRLKTDGPIEFVTVCRKDLLLLNHELYMSHLTDVLLLSYSDISVTIKLSPVLHQIQVGNLLRIQTWEGNTQYIHTPQINTPDTGMASYLISLYTG